MFLKIKKFNPINSRLFYPLRKRRHSSSLKRKHAETFFRVRPKNYSVYFLRNWKFNKFETKITKSQLSFGYKFGIKNLKVKELKSTPLIAIIKLLKKLKNKYKKKIHRLRFNILTFPIFQKTAKPKEVRMGKGRGALSHNVYNMKIGNLVFQLRKKKFLFFNKFKKYTYLNLYLKTLKQAKHRLPFKNIILRRLW